MPPYSAKSWSNLHHQGVVVPPENYPNMSGTLIQLFRHLDHQNLSFISDFIDSQEKKWGAGVIAGIGAGGAGNLIHVEEDYSAISGYFIPYKIAHSLPF